MPVIMDQSILRDKDNGFGIDYSLPTGNYTRQETFPPQVSFQPQG